VASLSITHAGSPVPNYIDEEVSMPSTLGSQTLRGVADAGDGSPLIAIASLADSGQRVLIECLGNGNQRFSKRVDLLPGETLITQACTERTTHGTDVAATALPLAAQQHHGPLGIALTSDGMPGSFAAFGLVAHNNAESRSFTAVTFADPK